MNNETIAWQAPTHEHREHGTDWYWAVSIVTMSLAVAFIIINNILLAFIVIIGVGILLVHTKNQPPFVIYEISRKGVRAGKTIYTWESLESFWILEENKDAKMHTSAKILLTSKKPLMPHIVIPLATDSLADAHQVLANMIPEEYQVEPLPDRLMRSLGF